MLLPVFKALKPYLINVVKMDACNHSTLSQAIIQSVSEAQIAFENVAAIVSDSATYMYCKKAYREVLSAVYPKSVYILCLHILLIYQLKFFITMVIFHIQQVLSQW